MRTHKDGREDKFDMVSWKEKQPGSLMLDEIKAGKTTAPCPLRNKG